MSRCWWDHPRSRGVYSVLAEESFSALGSSPLARGLRPSGQAARALALDHPRSRGVYGGRAAPFSSRGGSSPLARGLLYCREAGKVVEGIIPARAGFTYPFGWVNCAGGDHPRSRGVYLRDLGAAVEPTGSSPLARGLPRQEDHGVVPVRIIPARAGFTYGPAAAGTCRRDHPRSRGVYDGSPAVERFQAGSSPLARGLLQKRLGRLRHRRIIPARAGFTSSGRSRSSERRDHPRSRGVYWC